MSKWKTGATVKKRGGRLLVTPGTIRLGHELGQVCYTREQYVVKAIEISAERELLRTATGGGVGGC